MPKEKKTYIQCPNCRAILLAEIPRGNREIISSATCSKCFAVFSVVLLQVTTPAA